MRSATVVTLFVTSHPEGTNSILLGSKQSLSCRVLAAKLGDKMSKSPEQENNFQGVIGKTIKDSEPWFEIPNHPGEDAPNIVIIL